MKRVETPSNNEILKQHKSNHYMSNQNLSRHSKLVVKRVEIPPHKEYVYICETCGNAPHKEYVYIFKNTKKNSLHIKSESTI